MTQLAGITQAKDELWAIVSGENDSGFFPFVCPSGVLSRGV